MADAGGIAVTIVPVAARDVLLISAAASSSWRRIGWLRSNSRRPASVGAAPMPLRTNSALPSSCSSRWTCRLIAGWEIRRYSEARL